MRAHSVSICTSGMVRTTSYSIRTQKSTLPANWPTKDRMKATVNTHEPMWAMYVVLACVTILPSEGDSIQRKLTFSTANRSASTSSPLQSTKAASTTRSTVSNGTPTPVVCGKRKSRDDTFGMTNERSQGKWKQLRRIERSSKGSALRTFQRRLAQVRAVSTTRVLRLLRLVPHFGAGHGLVALENGSATWSQFLDLASERSWC